MNLKHHHHTPPLSLKSHTHTTNSHTHHQHKSSSRLTFNRYKLTKNSKFWNLSTPPLPFPSLTHTQINQSNQSIMMNTSSNTTPARRAALSVLSPNISSSSKKKMYRSPRFVRNIFSFSFIDTIIQAAHSHLELGSPMHYTLCLYLHLVDHVVRAGLTQCFGNRHPSPKGDKDEISVVTKFLTIFDIHAKLCCHKLQSNSGPQRKKSA